MISSAAQYNLFKNRNSIRVKVDEYNVCLPATNGLSHSTHEKEPHVHERYASLYMYAKITLKKRHPQIISWMKNERTENI